MTASETRAVLVAVLLLCSDAVLADPLTLAVPGKTISLDATQWRKLEDEADYAVNYEERAGDAAHVYKRIVTVYMLPMSRDRRHGIKISSDEYIEFFVVHVGDVTLQTRLDRGQYWVLCRETLRVPDSLQPNVARLQHYLSADEQRLFWQALQNQVDDTRYLLRSLF